MKFEESGAKVYPNTHKEIIYFLLDDNDEVVYVGQSITGLARPYSHRDKLFTKVAVIDCEGKNLDEIETKYIIKYKAKYNKNHGNGMYSLMKARDTIRELLLYYNFSRTHLNYIIKELNIEPVYYNYQCYLTKKQLSEIFNELHEMRKFYKINYEKKSFSIEDYERYIRSKEKHIE